MAEATQPAITQDTSVRLELRRAIHMGEVTVEGTDLLGDGINVVSRLQEHAPIGGVLVSAAVMDLIAGRIEEPIEELGSLKLRNMSRAPKVVAGHAYAVGPGRRSTVATAPGSLPPSARTAVAVQPIVPAGA